MLRNLKAQLEIRFSKAGYRISKQQATKHWNPRVREKEHTQVAKIIVLDTSNYSVVAYSRVSVHYFLRDQIPWGD